MKPQTDALRRAEGKWNRSSGTASRRTAFPLLRGGATVAWEGRLAPAFRRVCGHACLSPGLHDNPQALRSEILLASLRTDMLATCPAGLSFCRHVAMLAHRGDSRSPCWPVCFPVGRYAGFPADQSAGLHAGRRHGHT
jgi:hypothetical protein